MANRIGPGPVFVYESLILSRRRQLYAGRALFVFAVFVGLATAWYNSGAVSRVPTTAGGPAATLLVQYAGSDRWKFWFFVLALCILAWAFAVAMFWASLLTFDRCMGRMPETSVSYARRQQDRQ